MPLHNIDESGFLFSSKESYVVLLIYKPGSENEPELASFPHSLWGIVKSASNLTPWGLQQTLSNQEELSTVGSLDSFLLSKWLEQDNSSFKYMLFVWNGKQASPLIKAMSLTWGFELDQLLHQSKGTLLEFFFTGGVIRGSKI